LFEDTQTTLLTASIHFVVVVVLRMIMITRFCNPPTTALRHSAHNDSGVTVL